MGWRGILGFEYGVVQAPMGPDMSGPELVAAVANSGCLGILKTPDWESPDHTRKIIKETRELTNKPFGASLILFLPHEENLKVILEEKVEVLQVSWGEITSELVNRVHSAGVKIVPQVGSFDHAKQAIEKGVDGIIVQGIEAGGHLLGQEGLMPLVRRVVDLVGDRAIPVIAAGGIVDGRGYAGILALGAQGVCLGTRFLATKESFAHRIYKKRLIEYSDTADTNLFGRKRWVAKSHHRVLQTPFFKFWNPLSCHVDESNQRIIAHATCHGKRIDIRRFAGIVPNKTVEGNVKSMPMYAGEGVGLIKEILPAAEVIKMIVREARDIIKSLTMIEN